MATYKSYYDDTTFETEGAREAYDALKDAWQVRYGKFDTLNEAFYARTGMTWRESKGGERLASEIPVSDGGTFGAEGNVPGSELMASTSGKPSGTTTPEDAFAYYDKWPKKTTESTVDKTDQIALTAISRVLQTDPDNELAQTHFNDIITKNNYTQSDLSFIEGVQKVGDTWTVQAPSTTTSGPRKAFKTGTSSTGTTSTGTTQTATTSSGTTTGTTTGTTQTATGGTASGTTSTGLGGQAYDNAVNAAGDTGGILGGLFGGQDAVDAAGKFEQARIIQAMDWINSSMDKMQGELGAGKDEFISKTRDTINQVKSQILSGNQDVAGKLLQGLEARIRGLGATYQIGEQNLGNAFNIIRDGLKQAEGTALGQLGGATDTARGDITFGRDNAIGRLRESLTNSLNSIASGRDQASQAISQSLQRTRQNYAPYVAAGSKAIARQEQLTNDPQAQLDYVRNNPFFAAMQETARDQLFANQAAKGRLGTGETLDQLDKNTLLLGEQLVGNAISRNSDIAGMGLNAAGNLSNAEMTGGNILAQIFQNAANQEVGANQNFGNMGAEVDMSAGNILAQIMQRYGENASRVSQTTGNNIAEVGANFTSLLNNNLQTFGMAGAGAEADYWKNLTNLVNNQTQQMGQLTQQQGMLEAGAQQEYRNTYAGLINQNAGQIGNLLLALGQSESNEVLGEQNARTDGFNTLLNIGALALGGFGNWGGLLGSTAAGALAGSTSGGTSGGFTMQNTFPSIPTNVNTSGLNSGINLSF